MKIYTLEPILKAHPFFKALPARYLKLLTGCARNVRFNPGHMIFRLGEEAHEFFIIREGKVSVEVRAPGGAEVVIQTLSDGDILGWSWLFSPYNWNFDARVVEPTRAISMDGACLRGKCEQDHDLGYELLKRFSAIMIERLQATRLQLMDLYGTPEKKR